MIRSLKYAHRVLRFGLAIIFFWFGVHKFVDPQYWINAWVPTWVIERLDAIGISATQFMYINGILEVVIALSLATAVFIKVFSLVGAIFLVGVIITVGGDSFTSFNEIMIRDIGLLFGFIALILWPDRGV